MNRFQWITAALAAVSISIGGGMAFAVLNRPPETQFLALAKGEYLGKRRDRICELSEADNAKILLKYQQGAIILRLDNNNARKYASLLQNGWDQVMTGFERASLPVPDRLYVVDRPGRSVVYPFFIVDGCVTRVLVEIPRPVHNAIMARMRGVDA